MHDEINPDLFREKLTEQYFKLVGFLGENVLKQVEKQVILHLIDKKWADFLEEVTAVREGIHLVSLGGKVPLDEFHSIVLELIRDMRMDIERETVGVLEKIPITAQGISLDEAGLRRPAATWTYLVNDTPFEKKMKGIFGSLFGT